METLFRTFELRVNTCTTHWENYELHCWLNDNLMLNYENTIQGTIKILTGLLGWHYSLSKFVRETHENCL